MADSKLQLIRAHCNRPGSPVLFDEPTSSLFDVGSIKTLPLNPQELVAVEQRPDKETRAPYLLLAYGNGRQLALTATGIAFAPLFASTGHLNELPDVVCFRDYAALRDRLKHSLYGHADEPVTRETVKLVMMCIAVIDGARAVGFDVSREERELEVHFNEVEKRSPRG